MKNLRRSVNTLWRPIRRAARRSRLALRRARVIIYLGFQTILILAGALVCTTLGAFGIAVGTSMIATGACGVLIFGWILYTEQEVERTRAIDDFGLVTAFPHRSIQIKQEYVERVATAREHIDVMGYGLNALREDFSGQFLEWSQRVSVRILIVDPEAPSRQSSFVNLRDREEQNNQGKTREEVERFIEDTRALWEDASIDFHLRLARSLPSVNMFRIDDVAFWGPYLISSARFGRASRNLPTMIVHQPGYMHDRLVDHFEEIWKSDELSRPPT
jgi:hypothetical protein